MPKQFRDEADTWLLNRDDLRFERKITVPGLSSVYPHIHCTADGDVCQMTTGESRMKSERKSHVLYLSDCVVINAALAVSALTASPLFDLTNTYFLIAGIAGINPKVGTLGSVVFARFAVQVDLQYEFDAREIPSQWNTGYVPQGASSPDAYPKIIYGTEIFEVNDDLKKLAMSFAQRASLVDAEPAAEYRARFSDEAFKAATLKPTTMGGDVTSSNVFFHGHLLAEGFENYFKLLTNSAGNYCVTAQEDTATLAALLRAAIDKRVDFSRIIIMRTASNFDRPFSRTAVPRIPLHTDHGGFEPAIENIYRAGVEVIKGILREWSGTFENGVHPSNYIGDVLGSLGADPGFRPGRKVSQPSEEGKAVDDDLVDAIHIR